MMPRSVVQSNWYYGEDFDYGNMHDKRKNYIKAYIDLEAEGYDQVPAGSFHSNNVNSIGNTVDFCSKNIDDKRLLGFLQTFWKPTTEKYRTTILQGIDLMGRARKNFDEKQTSH